MPDTLRFVSETQPLTGVVTQTVYYKTRWDAAWQAEPLLWCTERVWAMAPTISTATLRVRYGESLAPGDTVFGAVLPLRRWLRLYVRIDTSTRPINPDDQTELSLRSWYGIIDSELDELLGPRLAVTNAGMEALPRGRNYFLAYGLESVLAQSWIDRSVVAGDNGEQVVQRALTFNAGLAEYSTEPAALTGQGNRSPERGDQWSYVFHHERTGGSKWTTRDIVEYLLAYATARNSSDERAIPFFLDDADSALPTWDEPILAAENLTVFDVLNVLVSRHRGLAWRAVVEPAGQNQGPDWVAIVPCTFLTDDLTLEGGKVFQRNPNQKILAFEQDRSSSGVIKRSSVDTVDQVIVRGERRTSTATFSFADGTLEKGWPADVETLYEEAASTAAGYPAAAEVEQRIFWNMEARKADKFKSVFARFVLPDPFNGLVGNGTGEAELVPLMPVDPFVTTPQPEPHAPDDQRFLPQLALLEGVEYQDDAIDSFSIADLDGRPARHLPPLVLFPRQQVDSADQTVRYRHADRAGLTADLAVAGADQNDLWSASVRVDHEDGALWVEVGNGLNLLIARTDFDQLAEDQVDPIPADYYDMLATLSVPWSSYAEARYPEDPPGDVDVVRRMVVRAPYHRLDYVVPETVVALHDKTGELLRTSTGGFVRDDRPKLALLAQLAYKWYGTPRKAVSFATTLVNNRLELGDLIVSIGDPDFATTDHVEADINSVVTLIRLVSPLAEGAGDVRPSVPRIEYETAFGELDVLQLVPRPLQR